MQCKARQKRKAGPLTELIRSLGPLFHFAEGVRRLIEQLEANGIADAPIIEVGSPAIHLGWCDELRLIDERSQHSGLVPARRPQRECETVIATQLFGELLNVADL